MGVVRYSPSLVLRLGFSIRFYRSDWLLIEGDAPESSSSEFGYGVMAVLMVMNLMAMMSQHE